jgi:hypothetical protein
MDGTLSILLVVAVALVPAALLHELGRAAAALLLTKGRVIVLLGTGRPLFALTAGRLVIAPTKTLLFGGECLHEAKASGRRATAILLAGPLAGDVAFVVAAAVALAWHGAADRHPELQVALFVLALVALVRASADLVRAHGHRPTPKLLPAAR